MRFMISTVVSHRRDHEAHPEWRFQNRISNSIAGLWRKLYHAV